MKVRALVIEDSPTVRTVILKLLRHSALADFEFVEAGDGMEALELFDPSQFDIISADWNMPRMSGVAFAYQVRAIPEAKHIPIVMITSERSMGKMMDAMDNAGVDAYVCKPFPPEELRQKLAPLFENLGQRGKKSGGLLGKFLGKK